MKVEYIDWPRPAVHIAWTEAASLCRRCSFVWNTATTRRYCATRTAASSLCWATLEVAVDRLTTTWSSTSPTKRVSSLYRLVFLCNHQVPGCQRAYSPPRIYRPHQRKRKLASQRFTIRNKKQKKTMISTENTGHTIRSRWAVE